MDSRTKRSVIAALFGNALEWYDFLLYASFAPIFAQIFFPTSIKFVSLIATFSLFALGFIMRPIGGVLLGHFADRVGRRKALIISMTIMTSSTTMIALVPDYTVLGLGAPLLFSLFRLIQGLAVGAELPGSTTYLIEQEWGNRRGFAGSLVLSSACLGIVAGAFTAFVFSKVFTEHTFLIWGWRGAYIIGGLLGIVGIYLRVYSQESPQYFSEQSTNKEVPLKILFSKYKCFILQAVVITSILALGNYLLIAYVTTFLIKSHHFILEDSFLINFIAILFLCILIPVAGFLSDIIGRKPVFNGGIISFLILVIPIFWLLSQGTWWYAFYAEILLAIVMAPINATVPTMIAEMFPTVIRASGISLSYNLGQAIFGGTAPLIALTLIEYLGNMMSPAYYVLVVLIITGFTSYYVPERYKEQLS